MQDWKWAAVPLALMAITGCGDGKNHNEARAADTGPATSQNFALSGFSEVEVTGPDDVTIRQGNSFSIKADGPQSEIDKLEIAVDGSTLSIGRKRGEMWHNNHRGVKIAITMPKLSAALLTGSGMIDADVVEGDAVKARITGSGDLQIAKLTATSLDLSISGSGDLKVGAGQIASGKYRVTGAGDITASGVAASDLDISVTGSGDVDAQANGSAKISIMGSGDVKIDGGAKCSTRKVGSGSVTCN